MLQLEDRVRTISKNTSLALLGAAALLTAPTLKAQSVTLAWDHSTSTNVIGYNIYYGPTSQSKSSKTMLNFTTIGTINGLSPGIRYYFTATAYTSSGAESDPSNEVNVLIPLGNWNPPRNPRKVSKDVSKGGPDSMHLMAEQRYDSQRRKPISMRLTASRDNVLFNSYR